MSKLVNALPQYRRHASGQAFVRIGGRNIYLGKHGTKASREKYARLLAEWHASDRPAAIAAPAEITITEVCAAFLRFAKHHYVKNGKVTDAPAEPSREPGAAADVPLPFGPDGGTRSGPAFAAVNVGHRSPGSDSRDRVFRPTGNPGRDHCGERITSAAREELRRLSRTVKFVFGSDARLTGEVGTPKKFGKLRIVSRGEELGCAPRSTRG